MDEKYLAALRTVASKLNESGIRWVLCGSTNFALQGMDVRPSDVDISVAHEDLRRVIGGVFPEYDFSDVRGLPSGEGEDAIFCVDGVKIPICGDYEHGV